MTDPRTPHHDHDPLLIAAHAAGDLSGRDEDRALHLLADCSACSALAADLHAVSLAVAEVPVPSRTRDFRLSPEDAARLRPGGWRRLLQVAAGPRFSLAGPLGATFASLGVAGLLLASAPAINLGAVGAAPAAADAAATFDTAAAPERRGQGAQGGAQGGAQEIDEDELRNPQTVQPVLQAPNQPGSSPVPEADGEVFSATDAALAQRTGDATLAILSGSFLIVGLGLFAIRWTARRLDDG